ncbi:MAG: 4Fe-4S dicluster domain-containing protein [bacterium]
MTTKLITRNSLKKLMRDLLTVFEIVAPVQGEAVSAFQRISAYEEIGWPDSNTARSPKEFFLPPADGLFRFQQTGRETLLSEPANHHGPRIILGVRPCDAAALAIMDRVFSEKGIDVHYTALRDNTLVIGQPCWKPGKDCFCTSVGINPTASLNMDIMLTDLRDERFLVDIVSPKGEDFFSYFSHFFQEPEDLPRALSAQTREMVFYLGEDKMFDLRVIKKWLDNNFENPLWTKTAARCIGCGACSFLCPTCHCFDFTDESTYQDNSFQGLRKRVWDSCSFSHFTQTPTHQPRPTQDRRFRQRIMHKFKYSFDRYQQLACVGCGRCRSLCPVGIDLVEVLVSISRQSHQF